MSNWRVNFGSSVPQKSLNNQNGNHRNVVASLQSRQQKQVFDQNKIQDVQTQKQVIIQNRPQPTQMQGYSRINNNTLKNQNNLNQHQQEQKEIQNYPQPIQQALQNGSNGNYNHSKVVLKKPASPSLRPSSGIKKDQQNLNNYYQKPSLQQDQYQIEYYNQQVGIQNITNKNDHIGQLYKLKEELKIKNQEIINLSQQNKQLTEKIQSDQQENQKLQGLVKQFQQQVEYYDKTQQKAVIQKQTNVVAIYQNGKSSVNVEELSAKINAQELLIKQQKQQFDFLTKKFSQCRCNFDLYDSQGLFKTTDKQLNQSFKEVYPDDLLKNYKGNISEISRFTSMAKDNQKSKQGEQSDTQLVQKGGENYSQNISELNKNIQDLNSLNKQLEQKNQNLQDKNILQEQKINELILTMKQDLEKYKKESHQYKRLIQQQTEEIEQNNQKFNQCKCNSYQQELEVMVKKIQELEWQLKLSQNNANESYNKQFQTELKKLQEQIKQSDKQIQDLQVQLKNSYKTNADQRNEIEKLAEQSKQQQQQYSRLQNENGKQQQQQQQTYILESKNKQLTLEIKNLQDQIQMERQQTSSMQTQLQSQQNEIKNLTEQIKQQQVQYEQQQQQQQQSLIKQQSLQISQPQQQQQQQSPLKYKPNQLISVIVGQAGVGKNTLLQKLFDGQKITKYQVKEHQELKCSFVNTEAFDFDSDIDYREQQIIKFRELFLKQKQNIINFFIVVNFERTDLMKKKVMSVYKFLRQFQPLISIIVTYFDLSESKEQDKNDLISKFSIFKPNDMFFFGKNTPKQEMIQQLRQQCTTNKDEKIIIKGTIFEEEDQEEQKQMFDNFNKQFQQKIK